MSLLSAVVQVAIAAISTGALVLALIIFVLPDSKLGDGLYKLRLFKKDTGKWLFDLFGMGEDKIAGVYWWKEGEPDDNVDSTHGLMYEGSPGADLTKFPPMRNYNLDTENAISAQTFGESYLENATFEYGSNKLSKNQLPRYFKDPVDNAEECRKKAFEKKAAIYTFKESNKRCFYFRLQDDFKPADTFQDSLSASFNQGDDLDSNHMRYRNFSDTVEWLDENWISEANPLDFANPPGNYTKMQADTEGYVEHTTGCTQRGKKLSSHCTNAFIGKGGFLDDD